MVDSTFGLLHGMPLVNSKQEHANNIGVRTPRQAELRSTYHDSTLGDNKITKDRVEGRTKEVPTRIPQQIINGNQMNVVD